MTWVVKTEAVIYSYLLTLHLLVPVKEAQLENGPYVLEQNFVGIWEIETINQIKTVIVNQGLPTCLLFKYGHIIILF